MAKKVWRRVDAIWIYNAFMYGLGFGIIFGWLTWGR